MPYLPVTVPPAIVVADNRDYVNPGNRPDPYPAITKYTRIEHARTQQRLNELAPKVMTDPEAARQYRELSDSNARQLQILTDPNGH
jgi:hypothetical protein